MNEVERVSQEKWQIHYICTTVNGKIHCLICNNYICSPKSYNLNRHYETNYLSNDKYEGPIRVSMLNELMVRLTQQQTFYYEMSERECRFRLHAMNSA